MLNEYTTCGRAAPELAPCSRRETLRRLTLGLTGLVLASNCGAGSSGGPDAGADAEALGLIGAACMAGEGCPGRDCLPWLEGGYCSVIGCATGSPCPDGSVCAPVRSGGEEQNVCLRLCDMLADCRTAEGYACDRDATCWPGPGARVEQPVGGPCTLDTDCESGLCMLEYYDDLPTGNTGGFCTFWDCFASGCPSASRCVPVTGGAVCLPECESDADCRGGFVCNPTELACVPGCGSDATCPDKHVCLSGWCVASSYGCGVMNPAGWCPSGEWCDGGQCRGSAFSCGEDATLEPNDSRDQAAPLSWGRTSEMRICEGDEDWYQLMAPAGRLTEVKLVFNNHAGNLDLLVYDQSGAFLRSLWREYPYAADLVSDFDVSNETLSFFSPTSDRAYFLRVLGSDGDTNTYGFSVRHYPYEDGEVCDDAFSVDECRGLPGGVMKLYQVPIPDPDDPYSGGLYDFATVGSYFWARRELIELIRSATRATAEAFPGTETLYLVDACQEDGLTPGHDIGALRHCRTCHDQGGNADIAYYQSGTDNWTRTVCGPAGSNVTPDGTQCTAAAASQHIVDVDRQVFFMARIFDSPRARAIGVDPVIATVLQGRATEMLAEGTISAEGHAGIQSRLGLWPTHHDHIHVSLEWW